MNSADAARLLRGEIAEVVGCTEPAAIAYAVQSAKRRLKRPFALDEVRVTLRLSPEVMRNASTAVIPTLNRRGIRAAVAAGLLSSSRGFNPFARVSAPRAVSLLGRRSWLSVVSCRRHGVYIYAMLATPRESVAVEIRGRHDSVTRVWRNGETIFRAAPARLPWIRGFAEIKGIADRRSRTLELVARDFILAQVRGDRTRSVTENVAALITERMKGKPLPVVTITGSGNQGLFLALPLAVIYRRRGADALPAALFSLLAQAYLCRREKRISDRCGLANKAAPALAAGLAYGRGDGVEAIERIVENVRGRLRHLACHGAKPGCGAKSTYALRCVASVLSRRVSTGDHR